MAAIQGLNRKLEERNEEIQTLKQKQADLEAKLEKLEKLLE
jgi:ubiquinone biosynthesis protein UbiJ